MVSWTVNKSMSIGVRKTGFACAPCVLHVWVCVFWLLGATKFKLWRAGNKPGRGRVAGAAAGAAAVLRFCRKGSQKEVNAKIKRKQSSKGEGKEEAWKEGPALQGSKAPLQCRPEMLVLVIKC